MAAPRHVEVDLDQGQAAGARAFGAGRAARAGGQNIVLPAGDQKIGADRLPCRDERAPHGRLPVSTTCRSSRSAMRRSICATSPLSTRGGPPQPNVVLWKGSQSVLSSPEDRRRVHPRRGRRVRAKLPRALLKTLPPGVTITPLNDASSFVRASIEDVDAGDGHRRCPRPAPPSCCSSAIGDRP